LLVGRPGYFLVGVNGDDHLSFLGFSVFDSPFFSDWRLPLSGCHRCWCCRQTLATVSLVCAACGVFVAVGEMVEPHHHVTLYTAPHAVADEANDHEPERMPPERARTVVVQASTSAFAANTIFWRGPAPST
jgi:hypothetical protein